MARGIRGDIATLHLAHSSPRGGISTRYSPRWGRGRSSGCGRLPESGILPGIGESLRIPVHGGRVGRMSTGLGWTSTTTVRQPRSSEHLFLQSLPCDVSLMTRSCLKRPCPTRAARCGRSPICSPGPGPRTFWASSGSTKTTAIRHGSSAKAGALPSPHSVGAPPACSHPDNAQRSARPARRHMPQRSQGPRGADPSADRPERFEARAGRLGPAAERPGSPAARPDRPKVPRGAWRPTSVAEFVFHRQCGTQRPEGKHYGRQAAPARTDLLWLLGAAAAFMLAVLAVNPLHQGFIWDETVYVSQISKHTPAMPWAPERARGMPLLVAPVTLITGSPTALRVYLSALAGVALFLALLAWRRLRPAWVLALAGLVFGGLGVAQAEAPLVFPNFWAAVGALATAGLFLRGVAKIGSPRVNAILLVIAVAFTTLMRPADA